MPLGSALGRGRSLLWPTDNGSHRPNSKKDSALTTQRLRGERRLLGQIWALQFTTLSFCDPMSWVRDSGVHSCARGIWWPLGGERESVLKPEAARVVLSRRAGRGADCVSPHPFLNARFSTQDWKCLHTRWEDFNRPNTRYKCHFFCKYHNCSPRTVCFSTCLEERTPGSS